MWQFRCPCVHTQVQSQVTKLQTRLNSNLLKRAEELSSTSTNPELTADQSGLQALQQDLQRAEAALTDLEGRLAAVEGKSDEVSKRVGVCLRALGQMRTTLVYSGCVGVREEEEQVWSLL